MDVVVIQRKGLAEAAGDFSGSLRALSAVELSTSLSGPLESLADLQIRIRELYDRQAQQDVLTLGITIDEYVRLIGSIKQAFGSRQKAWHSWHAAEGDLQKRKTTQEKLLRQGKSQQDRLNQMQGEVADSERKVHQARLLFEDMGRLMKSELDRFEREKVEDFKSAVETFLESAVEAQKEVSYCNYETKDMMLMFSSLLNFGKLSLCNLMLKKMNNYFISPPWNQRHVLLQKLESQVKLLQTHKLQL